MRHPRVIVLLALLSAVPGLASGQSPDPAAERARLGNERIQAEAERRAREELEQQDRAAAAAGAVRTEPNRPPGAGQPAQPVRPPIAVDRTASLRLHRVGVG